jgi:hypothetical protein
MVEVVDKVPFTVSSPLVRLTTPLFCLELPPVPVLVPLITKLLEHKKEAIVDVRVAAEVVVGVIVDPTLTELQAIEPAPVILALVLAAAAEFRLIAPETVTVIPALTVRVAAAPVNVMEAQVVVTSPVRTTPLGIITASAEVGAPFGDQVPGVFQFPVEAVFCPKATKLNIDKLNPINNFKVSVNFLFINT